MASAPKYSWIFFLCLLLPLASCSKLSVFSQEEQEPLPLSFLQFWVFFPIHFQLHQSHPAFPRCLCFCFFLSAVSLWLLTWESLSSGGVFPTSLRLLQMPAIRCTNFHPFVLEVVQPTAIASVRQLKVAFTLGSSDTGPKWAVKAMNRAKWEAWKKKEHVQGGLLDSNFTWMLYPGNRELYKHSQFPALWYGSLRAKVLKYRADPQHRLSERLAKTSFFGW